MRKVITLSIALVAALSLASCASAPKASGSESSAQAKARSAVTTVAKPSWVDNPKDSFPESKYVAAVGYGPDRESAEKSAMGSLVSIFGQTVKGETVVSSRYSEAVKSGTLDVSESTDVGRAVTSSFDLETVVGAEIKGQWDDGRGTTYAVAVMDKAKASLLYADLIESNESAIRKLMDVSEAERYTLDTYARYDLAAEIADTNGRFVNVLSVVSPGAAAARRSSLTRAEDIRVESLKIAQNIPIAVSIKNDRDGRLAGAFSSVLTSAGFKTGGAGSRYTLDGTASFADVELPDNPNSFVRYTVDAALKDRVTGNALVPYTVTGRDGHATKSEAENRAVRAAERKIKGDFGKAFTDYLAGLGGKR
jgi:hypothetical protein